MKGKYLLILIAAWTWAQIAVSQTWIAGNAPLTNFSAVAYSTNGDKVAASSMGIYTSTNFGLDWKLTGAPVLPFFTIACSSDGNQIFATVYHGPIYASRDAGLTWNKLTTPGTNWSAVACSVNGNILLAAAGTVGGALYVSTNSGVTWSLTAGGLTAPLALPELTGQWTSVALSADGKKMFAETADSNSYVSTDSGTTWNPTGAALAFAISSDGQRFIGNSSPGFFISTNAGISGTLFDLPSAPGFTATIFGLLSMSADGLHVIGDELCGALYTSEDGGTNWSIVPGLGGSLNTVAQSPNGAWRLIAQDFGGVQISYVPESVPLFITQPMAATNVYEGTTVTLKTVALGSAPIVFQWQHNGTNLTDDARITGSTTSQLTITNLDLFDSGEYALVATNGVGLTNSETATVNVLADMLRPSVTILEPLPGKKIKDTGFSVTGTARDNAQIAGVWYQLNSGPWQLTSSGDGWHNWSSSFSPTNGLNTIRVFAVDQVGNVSATNSVTFKAVKEPGQIEIFLIVLSGEGKISPLHNAQMVTMGATYKIKATPARGYLFSGWTGSVQSTNATVSFTVDTEMSIEADFTPNPFFTVNGKYEGTVSPPPPFDSAPTGELTVQVLKTRAFAARLKMGKKTYHYSGKFAADGTAKFTISKKGMTPFDVTLNLDLNGDGIMGTDLTGADLKAGGLIIRQAK